MKYAATVAARVVVKFDAPVTGPNKVTKSMDVEQIQAVEDARSAAARHAEETISEQVKRDLEKAGHRVESVVIEEVTETAS